MSSTNQDSEEIAENTHNRSAAKVIVKYFLHGILFSLLFTLMGIGGIVVMIFLVLLGSIIGLVIGIIIFILIAGAVNSVIADLLWGLSMDMSVKILFLHGLILFVVLAVVNGFVVIAPQLLFPGTATSVATFIVGSVLDGMIGKYIAEIWGGSEREGDEMPYDESYYGRLPPLIPAWNPEDKDHDTTS